jgi:hypothetical protein
VTSMITRKEEITASNMDGEIVMMNIETGNYYNLGKTGSVIWTLLENPITVDALIEKLLKKYHVSRQQCEDEVMAFLNEVYIEGLIMVR